MLVVILKVERKAKIRKRYNQEPYLTGTPYRKATKHNKHEIQYVSPLPAGDHKTARYRQDNITKINMEQKNNKKDQQRKHCLGTVNKKSLEDLNIINGTNLNLSSDVE